MEKYYVVSIQIMKDETQAQSIVAYDDKKSALSAYHSTLASNYISETLKAFSVVCLNYHGGTEAREYWEYVEPTPEPNEV